MPGTSVPRERVPDGGRSGRRAGRRAGRRSGQRPEQNAGQGSDLFAALSTAVIALPGNIVFGMIAFAPLGPSFVTRAILTSWICSIVLGGFSALLSPTTGLISGPRAGVALAVAAYLIHLGESFPGIGGEQLLSLLFLMLLVAALMQTLMGLLRLGDIIKYISYPVIVGVINSKVLLLLKSQGWNIIGVEKGSAGFFAAIGELNPYALGLSVFTLLLFFLLRRMIRRVPVHILVILVGCTVHHLLIRLGITADPGRTLLAFEAGYSNIFYAFADAGIFGGGVLAAALPGLLVTAFSIAILSSTDTLLTSLAIQNISYESVDANRELMVQGVGNILSVFAGGLVGGGSSTRSMTNVLSGGRSRAAAGLYVLFVLVIATLLRPLIRFIPLSVIAGMVMIIAVNMFDTWIFELFRRLRSRAPKEFEAGEIPAAGQSLPAGRKVVPMRRRTAPGRRRAPKRGLNTAVLGNLSVILTVILISLLSSLVAATLAGMAISFFLYVYRKSKVSMLRKIYTGAGMRSKTQRPGRDMELLSAHGDEIFVAELEGSLFFGTADELSERIDTLIAEGGRYIILDLKRVSDIDSSGGKILERVSAKSRDLGCRILFAYLSEGRPLWDDLRELGMEMGMDASLDASMNEAQNSFFPDTDSALEYCENRLLERYRPADGAGPERVRFDVFRDFTDRDMRVIRGLLTRRSYGAGEYICRQGDPGDSLSLIASGAAVITINLPGDRGEKKLETLCAGTLFGEMGLVEGKPRSANVRAVGETVCLILDRAGFERIKLYHTGTYVRMMNNILRTLSSRLRYANVTISELES